MPLNKETKPIFLRLKSISLLLRAEYFHHLFVNPKVLREKITIF